MPKILVIQPDGSFYYKDAIKMSSDDKIHPKYQSHYSCTGFRYNEYVFVFDGCTTIKKEDYNPDFNFIADEAFKILEPGGPKENDHWIAVGDFIVYQFLDGELVDIVYQDFHNARNQYMRTTDRIYCVII